MVRSMTGYGRAQIAGKICDATVEIKSVNHRYFEFSARYPKNCAFLEEKLKSYVQSRVSRGKVDVYVSLDFYESDDVSVELNRAYADSYVAAARSIADIYSLENDITASVIARNPEVFTVKKSIISEEEIWADVEVALSSAVDNFIRMREVEGERLKADVVGRTQTILGFVESVEEMNPQTVAAYRERLYAKIKEVLGSVEVDEQRVITEVALFADKVAVDEETVRLRSHIKQFTSLMDKDEAVGRKLDFIVQEMNREANTIGSKSQNAQLQMVVVNIKAEIEKIREQIQNME
ncbi:MAG: YicC family protein [Clostridia bacterium]|nr:YicC family protein [Clostridia bacterium]